MTNDSYYYKYLFCVTAYICTSTDAFGSMRLFPLLFFAFYLIFVILTNPINFKKSIQDSKFVGIFVLLIALGIFRNNLPNFTAAMAFHKILSIIIFYLSTAHILRLLLIKNDTIKILNLVLVPFFFLGILNIIFFFIGVSREVIVAKDSSILMGLIGFGNFNRVNFFLVGGVNSYGALNGACLVIALLSFIFKLHKRKTSVLFVLIFLAIAFFTDSRGALVFGVFSVAIAAFYHMRRKFLFLKILPYLVFLAPFAMFLLFPILASSDSFSSLSRGENDLATGNSRFFIWAIVFNDLLNDGAFSLFGNGDGGLYLTQSYKLIAELFINYDDIVINSQNSIISILLDFGIIALILFFIILFTGIKVITRRFDWNPELVAIASAILIYILLIGITEAIVGMYYQNSFVIFIYVFCLPFLIPRKTQPNF